MDDENHQHTYINGNLQISFLKFDSSVLVSIAKFKFRMICVYLYLCSE